MKLKHKINSNNNRIKVILTYMSKHIYGVKQSFHRKKNSN